MSENAYEYVSRDWSNWKLFVRSTHPTNPLSIGIEVDGTTRAMHLPTDPAELNRLAEAILGRKVAAVIYEDELPEVVRDGVRVGIDGAPTGWFHNADPVGIRAEARTAYLEAEAAARHIEARDAAAKEQEREVESKALELYEVFNDAQEEKTHWDDVREDVQEGFIAVARHELGARATQGEEAGR